MRGHEFAWEREARNWIEWARTPQHDAYWLYADSFFDQIVPPPKGLVIDVGCGEGRVSRDLKERGHDVVSIDLSPTLIEAAATADPKGIYLRSDASALPFESEAFDQAIAYNSLMDVYDMPGVVREVARVLKVGGSFSVCVTHPLADAGRFEIEGSEPTLLIDDYLTSKQLVGTYERDGLTMTFESRHHPLQDYSRAFESAGLVIEVLREPSLRDPDSGLGATRKWRYIPMFLFVRTRKS